MDLTDAQRTWRPVLDELKMQMTSATFDTWLLGSQVISVAPDGSCITVQVRSAYAVDWLHTRLRDTVEGTAGRHFGHPIHIEVVGPKAQPAVAAQPAPQATPEPEVQPEPEPEPEQATSLNDILSTTVEFIADPSTTGGWHPTSRYATQFWQPFLGPVAWSVYNLVRSDDVRTTKTLWTPYCHYEISYLARLAAPGRTGRGNRSAIVGRWRRRPCDPALDDDDPTLAGSAEAETVWYPGAFDVMCTAGVAHIRWHNGDGRWRRWEPGGAQERRERARAGHELSVVTWLPYLTPREIACLPDELQGKHQRHLRERGIDVDEWRRLLLPTLAGLNLDTPELTAALAAVTGAQAADIRHALSFFAREEVPNAKKSRSK